MGRTRQLDALKSASLIALIGMGIAVASLWAQMPKHNLPSAGKGRKAKGEGRRAQAPKTQNPKPKTQNERMLFYDRWQTFTTKDGLPSDKTNCVKVDGDRVWVGTDDGLACYEQGSWRAYRAKDCADARIRPHPTVLAIDVSAETGDVWVATLGGLCRFSGGRFDCFNQMNSGLANDVVYGVACQAVGNGRRAVPQGENVWAATAAGASRFNTHTREWAIFNNNNTLMFEPWTYGVCANEGMVYFGVWGGGVVEYNLKTGHWRDYRDPDGEMEIDLFKDDGLVHDVIPSVAYENGVLWAGSYFGLSRYDGRHWKNYFQDDSGLASDFINFVRARGNVAWICTDNGLSSFDGTTWVTYRKVGEGGERIVSRGKQVIERRHLPQTLAHNYVLGVDLQGDDVWVATAKGVSRGIGSQTIAKS